MSSGESIGDVVQLLVWEVNEIERVEVEKEPKDWAVGDEVRASTHHTLQPSTITTTSSPLLSAAAVCSLA